MCGTKAERTPRLLRPADAGARAPASHAQHVSVVCQLVAPCCAVTYSCHLSLEAMRLRGVETRVCGVAPDTEVGRGRGRKEQREVRA